MSVQVRFSEKSPTPQPFTEPENMTTIELDKSEYSDDTTVKEETINKFKVYNVIKSLLIGIGLFILLGLCSIILLLLVHRGYNKSANARNESIHMKETTFQILLSNKDKVTACRTSKSLQDCCYIFFKAKFGEAEKCTVEKVLNLFLQYELEANKRPKRQDYDYPYYGYENQMISPDYYQQNMYQPGYNLEYPENYETQLENEGNGYYQQFYNDNNENVNNYYQEDNRESGYPMENPHYYNEFQENQNERNADFDVTLTEMLTNRPELPPNIGLEFTQPVVKFTTTSSIPPKTCQNCTSVIKASTKIANITNVNAESGKIEISLNNTQIKLRNNPRISQGTDFETKTTEEEQSSTQSRQVNPCFYPMSPPFVPQYSAPSGFNSNPVFGMPAFQQQPLYVINPPVYPSLPMNYQGYGAQNSNKNAIQVAGSGGQYYLCKPVTNPTNNVAGLPGVEIRRMSEAFTLQEMIDSMPKNLYSNKTREALDCPFGTRPCSDGSKCIHNKQICDNEVNCNDASDEMHCSCRNRVGELRWCDGYLDCPNGEDEENCFDCDVDEISCDDWSRFQRGTCVSLSQKCDGIKQCEITGKDEEDCSLLADHLGQHSINKISNAAGFLHRNYKGRWYPTCFGVESFALEVCKTEAGPNDMVALTHLIASNDNYPGPYLDFSPNEGITLAQTCLANKAVFVECPPLFCGLRLTITNPFRLSEIDTSAEAFLTRLRTHDMKTPIVGDSRVVGGKPSQPTSWPWIVAIYKNGVFHCGGVLINELWVLTAAHCVDKFWFYYYEIQAGILRRFSYSPMEQTRWATIAIPHEKYSKKTLKNDIAIMKLSKPVRFNRYVRPICLPSETTAGEDFLRGPKANTVCVTVGWGATVEHGADPDHLREVEVPILGRCKHREDQEGDEICAGLLEGGRDACQGDSGGPLMCQNPKRRSQWYLAGIVSHGEGCARPDEPGVYTKVSKYIGWINENINGKTVGRFPLQKCPGYVCSGTRRCIPKKRHCDKIVDCLFGDDEVNCWDSNQHADFRSPIVGKQRSFFNKILEFLHLDHSSNNSTKSNSEHVVQNNITSVNVTTKQEKTDSSDFIFTNNFVCKNLLQRIPFHQKCDRVVNCEDGTDESDCLCVDYLKKSHKGAICDGVTDCKDMSDEADCMKCSAKEHFCRISQKCISSESRCDGRTDCINAEDEWDCVALTDGRTLVFDSDLRPKQSIKGIITINRFGVWRPLCTNASVDNEASIAANVCNLLGFEDYTVFHKLSVPDKPLNVTIDGFQQNHSSLDEHPLCGGLFVRCLNMSLADNVGKLHQDNVTNQVELYTSPWHAVIYLNGKFRCTGTILNPHWIITVKTCLQQVDAYIAVLLGKGKAHLDVEGPHEQVILIDSLAFIKENDAIILHTPQKIHFTRYIQPAMITTKSRFIKEQCVAIGFQDKKSQMLVLQPKKECTVGFRCFEEVTVTDCKENENDELWDGVITCNSRDGWYTAATYTNISNPCDFNIREFPNINQKNVLRAMGGNVVLQSPPECDGFRCSLGECLEKRQVCDGVADCRNGDDEDLNLCLRVENQCYLSSNCTKQPYCTLTEFKCPNGECVPKSSFCDTINDCKDNYDEPEVCSCRTYLETVHPEKICDGTVNCWDRSDEKNCSCRFPANITCGKTDLCISQEMVCDGFRDCPNGEDESRCYSLKTTLGSINRGEVLKCTAGVWHSGCFSRNHTTSELEGICERLGFSGSSATEMTKQKNDVAEKPLIDRFDVVWIRGKESGIRLRIRTGNDPYVKFVEDSGCHRLFIECM